MHQAANIRLLLSRDGSSTKQPLAFQKDPTSKYTNLCRCPSVSLRAYNVALTYGVAIPLLDRKLPGYQESVIGSRTPD